MNKRFLPDQAHSSENFQHPESMLEERLARIEEPTAYDYRMLANFYLNAGRYEEANAVQFQMLQLASTEDNPELLQSLYQDFGWAALLSGDPEAACRHFSCQRATLEEIHEQSRTDSVYRESDLNLFVATYRSGSWSTSMRHLMRLKKSFETKGSGFREFVIGRQETCNGELPEFNRLRTMAFLETLEQADIKQTVNKPSDIKTSLN
jgi:hypothetical protein